MAANPYGVGGDLRVLRKQRGLTLSDVASAVGRSVGWLSQVERHISKPDPSELAALARVLGVATDTLRSGQDAPERIVRKTARRPLSKRAEGLVEELLSPDLTDDFELVHSTFAPGAHRLEPIRRDTQEVGFIASGRLDLNIGGAQYILNSGDSFRLRGEPFTWANPYREPCVAIWAIAPPVY